LGNEEKEKKKLGRFEEIFDKNINYLLESADILR